MIDAGQLGSAQRIHHDRAVAYADANHVVAGIAAPAFAAVWTERHAGAGRLHAEHAAGRGWNTNRTTAIAGMREGQHARRHRRGCAAGRAAGGVREIPGILRRSVQARLGGRQQPHFRAGAFAEDGKTGVETTLREGAAVIGDEVLENGGAEGRARAAEIFEVLQQERHAGEGTVRQALLDLFLRIVVVLDHDGVQLRIDLGGARQRLVEQLLRRDLLLAHEVGEADAVIAAIFLEGHRSTHWCQEGTNRLQRKAAAVQSTS